MGLQKELHNLSVLLIEDQSDVREMVVRMLNDLGVYRIHEYAGAQDAVEKLWSNYDVVICDWNMPGMSGLEMLRKVRVFDASLPFLMMTGRADADSVLEARNNGVSGYISKPFTAQQLEAKLRIVLHRMAKAS